MKFLVDTADVAEIKDLAASDLLDGVTTAPSLTLKAGRPMLDAIQEISAIEAFLDDWAKTGPSILRPGAGTWEATAR